MAQELTSTSIPITEVPAYMAEHLSYSYNLSTIRKWAREGSINSFKIAGRRYVDVRSIDTFLKKDN